MRCVVGLAALALAVPASAATSSGLYGKVVRGPVTPVCTVEQPCYAPAAGVTLTFLRSGAVAGRTTTDAQGRYRIALAPGYYSVRTVRSRIGRGLEPASVHVLAARWLRIGFSIDTGIR